jgi:hypothetical protein
MVYCVREAKGVSNVAQTLWSRALDPLMAESIGRGLGSSLCRACPAVSPLHIQMYLRSVPPHVMDAARLEGVVGEA